MTGETLNESSISTDSLRWVFTSDIQRNILNKSTTGLLGMQASGDEKLRYRTIFLNGV